MVDTCRLSAVCAVFPAVLFSDSFPKEHPALILQSVYHRLQTYKLAQLGAGGTIAGKTGLTIDTVVTER